ncbi:hypothetical protein ACEQ6A_15070 [Rhizobium brockwellii]|uniref:hypothetical protein n=1 Tax=Rhizobium brockwellii TaxID=3019932 RepID=UPI003F98CACD
MIILYKQNARTGFRGDEMQMRAHNVPLIQEVSDRSQALSSPNTLERSRADLFFNIKPSSHPDAD